VVLEEEVDPKRSIVKWKRTYSTEIAAELPQISKRANLSVKFKLKRRSKQIISSLILQIKRLSKELSNCWATERNWSLT
jgi:hypothetical protein